MEAFDKRPKQRASKAYRVGYAYSAVAMSWAQQERTRLREIIAEGDDMSHAEEEVA